MRQTLTFGPIPPFAGAPYAHGAGCMPRSGAQFNCDALAAENNVANRPRPVVGHSIRLLDHLLI